MLMAALSLTSCKHACCIFKSSVELLSAVGSATFFPAVQKHNVTSSTSHVQSDKLIRADLAGLFYLLVTCSVYSMLMKSSLSPVHLN